MDLDTNRYTDPVPLGGDQVAPPLPPHDLDTGEVLPPLEQDGPIPEHAAAPQPRPQSPQEVFPPQLAAGSVVRWQTRPAGSRRPASGW